MQIPDWRFWREVALYNEVLSHVSAISLDTRGRGMLFSISQHLLYVIYSTWLPHHVSWSAGSQTEKHEEREVGVVIFRVYVGSGKVIGEGTREECTIFRGETPQITQFNIRAVTLSLASSWETLLWTVLLGLSAHYTPKWFLAAITMDFTSVALCSRFMFQLKGTVGQREVSNGFEFALNV